MLNLVWGAVPTKVLRIIANCCYGLSANYLPYNDNNKRILSGKVGDGFGLL